MGVALICSFACTELTVSGSRQQNIQMINIARYIIIIQCS